MTTKAEWLIRDAETQRKINNGTLPIPNLVPTNPSTKPNPQAKPTNPNGYGGVPGINAPLSGWGKIIPTPGNLAWAIGDVANHVWDWQHRDEIAVRQRNLKTVKEMAAKREAKIRARDAAYPIDATIEDYNARMMREEEFWKQYDLDSTQSGSEASRARKGFGPAGGNTSITQQESWIAEHTIWNNGKPVVYVMEPGPSPGDQKQQRLLGTPDQVRAFFTMVVPQAEQQRMAGLATNTAFPAPWEARYQDWLKKYGWSDVPDNRTKFLKLAKAGQIGG